MENQASELSKQILMEEVRAIARMMGILSVNKYECHTDLIRVIQLARGHEPCFDTDGKCRDHLCMWSVECGSDLKRVAGTGRSGFQNKSV